jgi:hypothetical protein
MPSADWIAFSPGAGSALLFSAAVSRLQVLSGLPDAPQVALDLDTATLPEQPTLGAVSDDGNLVLVASATTVYRLRDGTFRLQCIPKLLPAKGSIRAMAVADFNGDGHLDIAACPERLGCFVYLNDGKGRFGDGIKFQEPEALPYSMIAADLNRDARPEIIVGYVGAPGIAYDGSRG